MTTEERGARVRFPPPLVFVLSLVAGVAIHFGVHPARAPFDRTIGLSAGIVVVLLGLALIASARIHFLRTGQSPAPWKPSPELILRGPYRFTRNPMYVGMTLITLGLGVALDILWISAGALPALLTVHLIAVLPEEQYLKEKFGESYEKYLTQVGRYL